MTEIKLHTFGEKLIVSEKVTLASGNINSAELHVTVDEAWAAYSNFSATFETKEYIEPVEKLMVAKTATEYVCIIPSEVLQHQGILEIGIRGISNDGEMAKTSSIAKYNIVKGASPGDITLKPTMDMYQQYLATMDSKTAPLFEAYKKEIQAEHEKNMVIMSEEYATFKAACLDLMKPVPLWTNPDPTNKYQFDVDDKPTVKFDADLSGYKHYIVVFYYRLNSGGTFDTIVGHNGKFCALCSEKGVEQSFGIWDSDGDHMEKKFIIEDDGITFTVVDNISHLGEEAHLIPYQVIGFCPEVE